MGTVHTIFWQSHIFRSSVKSSLLMAKSHHSWRNPYWLAWPSVDWIRSSLNKWGLLQSFEVLSAEFMHSDIADEESRARSLRWAQPIFWASQRPFPWLGMVYTTHLPWFFGWFTIALPTLMPFLGRAAKIHPLLGSHHVRTVHVLQVTAGWLFQAIPVP